MTFNKTKVVNSNPVHGDAYSIQRYVIKFVSDLRQVGAFLWEVWFPPPIKLTLLKVKQHIPNSVQKHTTLCL